MRHDWHFVEEISKSQRTIGKVLPIDKIEPNPLQPRTEIGDLSELAASIKDRGILEPILVKSLEFGKKWLIIAGERRWRAASLAGLKEVPCIELDVDDSEIAEIALIENLQRKDLTIWEEADGLAVLCQRYGYTHADVSKRIGKSRTTVTESLSIAALPAEIREKCQKAGLNSKSTILQIARQFDDESTYEAITAAAKAVNQRRNNQNQTEKKIVATTENLVPTGNETQAKNLSTNLSTPVRTYTYQPPLGNFKMSLKFKKPVGKEEIIKTLQQIISELEK